MSWKLPRFRAGDLVEVLSREEVLATLDDQGCVEGLPFMPEMLAYCGRQFRVSAVAHKTCETAHKTWKGRRLDATVHLAGLRCDGAAHGGCQAECNLFWKEVWLKPAGAESSLSPPRGVAAGCSETQLRALAVGGMADGPASDPARQRYACQATRLYAATRPLAWWNPRQYVRDITTRNHSWGHVARVLFLQTLSYVALHTPIAWRLINGFRERIHRRWTGCDVPDVKGAIPAGERTPTSRLDLRPGELVRVKSKEEILRTIDVRQLNRGLSFDVEMTPYCGKVFRVRRIVRQILDELTGEMMHMGQPCIVLEGVVCGSRYSECRLMCPRAITPYWREIWLERVAVQPSDDASPALVAIESSVPHA